MWKERPATLHALVPTLWDRVSRVRRCLRAAATLPGLAQKNAVRVKKYLVFIQDVFWMTLYFEI